MPVVNSQPAEASAHTVKRRRTDDEAPVAAEAPAAAAASTVADDIAEQHAAITNELVDEAVRAEGERDAALAEVDRLTLKYEPVDGVLMTKTMELAADDGTCLMVVAVRTGERLRLELVQRPRAGWAPNWRFMPSTSDHTLDLGGYGTYDVCIGNGNFGQDVVVTFARDDVRFVVTYWAAHGDGPMTIKEFKPDLASAVTLPIHGE
jgi:hypothetical protein